MINNIKPSVFEYHILIHPSGIDIFPIRCSLFSILYSLFSIGYTLLLAGSPRASSKAAAASPESLAEHSAPRIQLVSFLTQLGATRNKDSPRRDNSKGNRIDLFKTSRVH